ncbi:hypothetical protein SK128_027710 [Halocaridina rubra]|uniref:Uncharacterized protein n=1 Tax=Halocaridina rubra TaxID=373956 RepID=A0AAN8XFS9_HALRR
MPRGVGGSKLRSTLIEAITQNTTILVRQFTYNKENQSQSKCFENSDLLCLDSELHTNQSCSSYGELIPAFCTTQKESFLNALLPRTYNGSSHE